MQKRQQDRTIKSTAPRKSPLQTQKLTKCENDSNNSTEKHQNTQSTTPCTCQKCQGFYMSEEYLIGGLGTTKGANGNPNASPRRPQEPSLVTPRAKPSTPHRPPPSPPTRTLPAPPTSAVEVRPPPKDRRDTILYAKWAPRLKRCTN